jgi:transposase
MKGKAYSTDLRSRVVAEVAAGTSRREAARIYRVSESSAIRWAERQEQTGNISPKPRGGRSRSPLEPHGAFVLALIAKEPDLTLVEIEQRLLETLGVKTTEGSIRRFFKRHAISFKKNSACRRTGSAGRGAGARAMEGRPGKP